MVEHEMEQPSFSAIDVETANADPASICQIGVVHVRAGAIRDHWQTLLNPETQFRAANVAIHGISKESVRNSPKLPDVYGELCRQFEDAILVSHTSFDRVALEGAIWKYDLPRIKTEWLDSSLVAREAWPQQRSNGGWSLAALAAMLGIEFRHHVAVEDARVAAEIVLRACESEGLSVEGWLRLGMR